MNGLEAFRDKKVLLVAAGLLIVGLLGGYWIGYVTKAPIIVNAQAQRENTTAYNFIHPLLLVSRPDISVPSPQYASLYKNVNTYIDSQKKSGVLTDASVIFIDYGKSGSFAINPYAAYAPASLLKVVIMVAYLKKSDSNPAILNRELTYAPGIAQSIEEVPFQDPSNLKIGETYTVSDLIDQMIIDSDNGAMNLLLANIDDAYLNDVYSELGMQGPKANKQYTISANDYSIFFRILYNGTYLSDQSSEKALSILSKATFKDGLVAGLPNGTTVAHKFGEHVNGSGDRIDSVELHDCGIVYPKGGPYLICVMTKGASLDALKTTIGTISKMAYNGAR